MTLFHPTHGILRCSPGTAPNVLDLTCGRYGLTGVIVGASLCLEAQAGSAVSIWRLAVGSAVEALPLVYELPGKRLAYSWHDAVPASRTFGRGFVYQGMLVPGPIPRGAAIPAHRVLTPAARARRPFSLWGGLVALMLRGEARAGELLRDVRPQALGDLVFRILDRNVGDVYYPWFWRVPCVALCGAPGTLFKRPKL